MLRRMLRFDYLNAIYRKHRRRVLRKQQLAQREAQQAAESLATLVEPLENRILLAVVGGFNIDGDVLGTGGEEVDAAFFSDPGGNDDELGAVNSNTTKIGNIHDDVPPTLEYTNPNPGNDLTGIWVDTNVDVNGDIWLYFAFQRDAATNGQVGFEFQREDAPLLDGAPLDYGQLEVTNPPGALPGSYTENVINNYNPWASRSGDGLQGSSDFLIVFDIQGSQADVGIRFFDENGGNQNQGAWTTLTFITDNTIGDAALSLDELTGEGAINLSQTVFPEEPTSCLSIATIIPYTVTGNSDQADFKDVVLADFASEISISNCGTVRVEKVTDPAGSTENFDIDLFQDDGGDVNFDGDTSLDGILMGDGSVVSFTELIADTDYVLTETNLPPGWVIDNITVEGQDTDYDPATETFSVIAGATTVITITNLLPFEPDAQIEIAPPQATNQVGDPHTLTATVTENAIGGGFVAAAGEVVVFEVTSGVATFVDDGDDLNNDNIEGNDALTDVNGLASVQIISSTTGLNIISATSDVDVDGTTVSVTTDGSVTPGDGGGLNSGPADKTFIDAKITITPDDATNAVGDDHTVTATVWLDDGDGVDDDGEMGTFDRYDGALVDFATSGTANPDPTGADDVATVNGDAQFTFTSLATGTVETVASTSITVSGVTFDLETDGLGNNSGPADKTFIDAKITITPDDATNAVGDDHTVTATVWLDDGTGSDLDGEMGFFDRYDGALVDFATSGTANPDPTGADDVATVNGDAQFTFTSLTTGTVETVASTSITASGVTFDLETDGLGNNSGPADKTFIDAKITITPDDATNAVGDDHTVTATVWLDDGTGSDLDGEMGFFDRYDGALVDFATSGTANPDPTGADDVATVNGDAQFTFTSLATGTVETVASTSITVSGVTFDLETDGLGNNSGPADKTFIDAKITITPDDATNAVGDDHTVTATVWLDDGTGSDLDGEMGFFDRYDGALVDFATSGTANPDPTGADDVATVNGDAQFTFTSLASGTVETVASTSITVSGVTFDLETDGLGNNSGPADKTFIDAKITITPDDATNAVGDDHTVTATVWLDDGDGVDDDGEMGTFDRYDGALVDFATSGTANPDPTGADDVATVNGDAQFTFTSLTTGTVETVASTSITVSGVTFDLETDGLGNNSGPADKTFIDAKITITPDDATNAVGDDHTVTATVWLDDGTGSDLDGEMGFFDRYDGALVDFATSGTANPDPTGADDVATVNGDAQFTFTSLATGTVETVASTSITVSGVTFDLETDGLGNNSGPADKTFIDAKITITPDDATNAVGDDHTVTATVWLDDGTGSDLDGEMGFFDRYDGALVDFATSGTANPDPTGADDVATVNGDAQFTFTSLATGTVETVASTSITVSGVTFDLETDGLGNNSGPADKTFIDAKITITPDDATNAVGDDHTVTATVWLDDGTGSDLDGEMGFFDRYDGALVDFATSGTANPDPTGADDVATVNGDAQFTFTSLTTGTVETVASTSITASGVTFDLETDGLGNNSGPADKTFIDAKITITPDDATNAVGDDHTVTATVWLDDGTGSDLDGEMGFFDRYDGALVDFATSGTANPDPTGADDVATVNGDAQFTFTSLATGTVETVASTSITVSGVTFDLETDGLGNNSGPADKTFIDAKITITPDDATNAVGDDHTVTATVWLDDGTGSDLDGEMGFFDRYDGALVDFATSGTANPDPTGADDVATVNGDAQFTFTSLASGTVETVASTSITVSGVTFDLETDGLGNNSGPADKTFIDAKITITPDDATNAVGDDHTVTATVWLDDGTGSDLDGEMGFFDRYDGALVDFATSGTANPDPTGADDVATVNGDAQFTFTSLASGTVETVASTSITVSGVTFDLETDGLGNNSGPADKTFIDAKITITPDDATNAVGDDHTVTATVWLDDGTGSDLDGEMGFFDRYDGALVDFATSGTANPDPTGADDVATVNGDAQFTFTSLTTGTVETVASTSITASGVTFDLETDGLGNNSGPADKTFIDAKITITPDDATNAVGDDHTVTATVWLDDGTGSDLDGEMGFFDRYDGALVDFATSGTANPDPTGADDVATVNGDAQFTFTSLATGTVETVASTSITVSGVTFDLETDGLGNNSGPADKTFIDAKITITPDDATNAVGDDHTVTATVWLDDGTGSDLDGEMGFFDRYDGALVDFATSGTANPDPTGADDVATVNGDAQFTFTSLTTGTVETVASTSITVSGVTFDLETDGLGNNSGPADKTFIDAKITITPDDATNAVGDDHTVTATVWLDDGTGSDLDGEMGFFDRYDGALVDFATSGTANPDPTGADDVATVNGDAQFTFTSLATGTVETVASTSITVSGVTFDLETDGLGNNSGPADKTFIDAKITITPDDATNAVGDDHTVTATVWLDDGTGSDLDGEMGFFDRYDGALVDFATSGTANPDPTGADDVATVNGDAQFTFTSLATGTVSTTASTQISVDGVTFDLATDGSTTPSGGENSDASDKTFIDAKITIDPDDATNRAGDDHTVTATVWLDDGTGSDADGEMGTFDRYDGALVDFSTSGTADPNPSSADDVITVGGDASFTFTSLATGTVATTASTSVTVDGVQIDLVTDGSTTPSGGENSDASDKTFIDAKITIDPDDATNRAGDDHTVTATVWLDDGTGSDADGEMGTFDRYDGALVDFSTSGTADPNPSSADDVITVGGDASFTFTSLATGTVATTASTSITVDGVQIDLVTDGSTTPSGGQNSGPAEKNYVDAKIEISPTTAENRIGDPHTLTVTVWEDDGTGSDADGEMGTFDRAAGEEVTLDVSTIVGLGSAAFVDAGPDGEFGTADDIDLGSSVTGTTGADGTFEATIISNEVSVYEIMASSDVLVGGIVVPVATDGSTTPSGGQNSPPALKAYFEFQASIEINSLSAEFTNGSREHLEGVFNIRDESNSGNQPDGFLVILSGNNYQVDWEYKNKGSWQDSFINGADGGWLMIKGQQVNYTTEYFVVDIDGVQAVDLSDGTQWVDIDGDSQQDPGEIFERGGTLIFDETINIGYTTWFDEPIPTKGTLRGTASVEGVVGRGEHTFTYRESFALGGRRGLLTLDGEPLEDSHAPVLSEASLQHVVDVAIDYWADQGEDVTGLLDTEVLIADLGGNILAQVDGDSVTLDDDAAGYGWSIGVGAVNPNRVDLLSALLHEFGHTLGYDHDVLDADLAVGERELPLADDAGDSLGNQGQVISNLVSADDDTPDARNDAPVPSVPVGEGPGIAVATSKAPTAPVDHGSHGLRFLTDDTEPSSEEEEDGLVLVIDEDPLAT